MKDKFLEKMIRQSGGRVAPPGFTERVMKRTMASSSVHMESVSRLSWALSIIGVAAAIGIIFLLDLSFLEDLFSVQQWKNTDITAVGQQMVSFWNAVTETFQLSSISLVIVGSVIALLLLDRIFRSRAGNAQYMSF